jgi:hypothetical protein
MKNKSLQKIINIIRSLHEESGGGAPTNSLIGGNIAGTKEAGDDPPVRKKKNYIYGTGFRKNWMQKRNTPQN